MLKLRIRRFTLAPFKLAVLLTGAYDARSLCHKVVVGFEKSKGNLFGLSNEPFVNKPARHPEHDGENTQLRNKLIARQLHEALELAQTASAAEVNLGLVHILRIGAAHAATIKATKIVAKGEPLKTSGDLSLNFLKKRMGWLAPSWCLGRFRKPFSLEKRQLIMLATSRMRRTLSEKLLVMLKFTTMMFSSPQRKM